MESKPEPDVLAVSKLKATVGKMFEGWSELRAEMPLISDRLKTATATKDKNAHQRAYRDLYNIVRKQLNRMPEKLPDIPLLFETPKQTTATAIARTIRSDAPIPLANQAGTIYMGCPHCDGWIDITKVLTQHIFDGIYKCEKGHQIIFGGLAA